MPRPDTSRANQETEPDPAVTTILPDPHGSSSSEYLSTEVLDSEKTDPGQTADIQTAIDASDENTLPISPAELAKGIHPSWVGKIFSGYEILGELARGGLGVVYLARQLKPDRFVALKVVKEAQFSTLVDIDRFIEEANAVAALEHPHIVPIHELRESGGCYFFSMRFLEGGSLQRQLESLRSEPRKAATLLATIARAIHFAHQNGVLHCDLKPSNILLDRDGRPHVVDFGISRRFDPKKGEAEVVELAGTPAYMAPEQVCAGVKKLTTAVDVYGLGALFYAILVGRPPYESPSSAKTIELIRNARPDPPRSLSPNVDPDLEAICQKCMARDPEARYPSASEVANDLDRYVRQVPVKARPATPALILGKWVRRRPIVAGSLGFASLAALTGVLLISLAWRVAEQYALQNYQLTYSARMMQASQALGNDNLAQVEELLEATRAVPRRWWPDLRGFEWNYLRRQTRLDLVTMDRGQAMPYSVDWSVDGKQVASAGDGFAVLIHDAQTGELVRELKHLGSVITLEYSPLGDLLATGDAKGRLWLWNPRTGERLLQLQAHDRWINDIAFAPDGKTLATAGREGKVKLWELPACALKGELDGHPNGAIAVAFSPDGRLLATSGRDPVARFWNASNLEPVKDLLTEHAFITHLAFALDSTRLATSGLDGLTVLWDVESGHGIKTLSGPDGGSRPLAFSPVGNRLAMAGIGQTIVIHDLDTDSRPLVLKGHQATVRDISYSPDGARLVSCGEDITVKIWDARVDRSSIRLTDLPEASQALAIDSLGGRLAAGLDDGTVGVWNLPAQSLECSIKAHEGAVEALAISPDGQWLASGGQDAQIVIHNLTTQREFARLKGHAGAVKRLAFAPDGLTLVSASDDHSIRVWNWRTARVLNTLQPFAERVWALAYSPDGRWLAAAGADKEHRVFLWDARTTHLAHVLKGHEHAILDLAFSADGERLASASYDRTARVWNVARGEVEVVLQGHKDLVLALGFSPDGKRLATAGSDRTVRLWELEQGKEVFSLYGHETPISALAFTPDGRTLASVSADPWVQLWQSTPAPCIPPLREAEE